MVVLGLRYNESSRNSIVLAVLDWVVFGVLFRLPCFVCSVFGRCGCGLKCFVCVFVGFLGWVGVCWFLFFDFVGLFFLVWGVLVVCCLVLCGCCGLQSENLRSNIFGVLGAVFWRR